MTGAIRNNAYVHFLGMLDEFIAAMPFMVTGIGCVSESTFINYDLIG